jgi:hypothetical protein
MQVSSELPLAAESVPSVLLAGGAAGTEPCHVEDEEFPADLPTNYDWMLQPASHRTSRRLFGFLAVILAAALIVVSVFVLQN